MEEDEPEEAPPPLRRQGLPSAMRSSVVDFYYHSVRFVPANLMWGLGLIGILMLAIAGGLWATVLTAPLLGVPLVGIYRLAGHAVRSQDVVFSDALRAMRERLVPALAMGVAVSWATLLLAINVLAGLSGDDPIGWGFATASIWGLVAIVVVSVAFWPILGDPARRTLPGREAVRLAALLALASPGRMLRLSIVATFVAVVSTIAFAAILSISVAFIAILSSRVVLPEADRLELSRGDLSGPPLDH